MHRDVGKSYIAEEFAKAEYKSYVLIDFNKVSRTVIGFFENDLDDLDVFFRKMSEYFGIRLYEGQTLFIFDGVQRCPRARASIKSLVADGRYHFLETGSLVSIQENVDDIVIFLLANEEMKRRKNVSVVEVKSEKDYSTGSLDKFAGNPDPPWA